MKIGRMIISLLVFWGFWFFLISMLSGKTLASLWVSLIVVCCFIGIVMLIMDYSKYLFRQSAQNVVFRKTTSLFSAESYAVDIETGQESIVRIGFLDFVFHSGYNVFIIYKPKEGIVYYQLFHNPIKIITPLESGMVRVVERDGTLHDSPRSEHEKDLAEALKIREEIRKKYAHRIDRATKSYRT